MWRCINRLDYGKKYCHDSPTIEEGVLKEAVMNAIFEAAEMNADLLKEVMKEIVLAPTEMEKVCEKIKNTEV